MASSTSTFCVRRSSSRISREHMGSRLETQTFFRCSPLTDSQNVLLLPAFGLNPTRTPPPFTDFAEEFRKCLDFRSLVSRSDSLVILRLLRILERHVRSSSVARVLRYGIHNIRKDIPSPAGPPFMYNFAVWICL